MSLGPLPGEGLVAERGVTLRSIQHQDARLSVLHRHKDIEVMMVEIGARGSLQDPTLWGGPSWHLVVEGEAVFQQGGVGWELLPGQSLHLRETAPFTIANPSRERLRLLSLVAADREDPA